LTSNREWSFLNFLQLRKRSIGSDAFFQQIVLNFIQFNAIHAAIFLFLTRLKVFLCDVEAVNDITLTIQIKKIYLDHSSIFEHLNYVFVWKKESFRKKWFVFDYQQNNVNIRGFFLVFALVFY
jgi:hypothetical protein